MNTLRTFTRYIINHTYLVTIFTIPCELLSGDKVQVSFPDWRMTG